MALPFPPVWMAGDVVGCGVLACALDAGSMVVESYGSGLSVGGGAGCGRGQVKGRGEPELLGRYMDGGVSMNELVEIRGVQLIRYGASSHMAGGYPEWVGGGGGYGEEGKGGGLEGEASREGLSDEGVRQLGEGGSFGHGLDTALRRGVAHFCCWKGGGVKSFGCYECGDGTSLEALDGLWEEVCVVLRGGRWYMGSELTIDLLWVEGGKCRWGIFGVLGNVTGVGVACGDWGTG
ncbi:hypothetical protein Tco_0396854 [Tanacetum coccineum]